jgi:hypothetical protein
MRGLATPTTPSTLADWVEISLLLGPGESLSASQLLDALQEDGSVDDLEAYDAEGGPSDDALDDALSAESVPSLPDRGVPSAREILAEDALGVLEQRARVVGDDYPLDVDLTRVYVARDVPVYRFLCALEARRLAGTRQGINRGARLFELLSAIAMTSYLGGRARAIGFPRRDSSGFRASVQALVREMRENLSVAVGNIPGSIKDLGVDVAAWRPLDDAPGNAVVLCQCATGGNWDAKGVELELWGKVVRHAVAPTRALTFPSIPDIDPASFEWELMCGRVGVPLHRLRLACLVQTSKVPGDLLREIENWSNDMARAVFGDVASTDTPLPAGQLDEVDLPDSLHAHLPGILIATRNETR